MKPRGLYELLLTKALAELLTQLPDRLEPVSEPLRSAEAADRIAMHVRRAVQKALEDIPEADRVKVGVDLVDRLLQQIGANNPHLLAEAFSGSVLRAIAGRLSAIDGRTLSASTALNRTRRRPFGCTSIISDSPAR